MSSTASSSTQRGWSDPRIPRVEDCVLGPLLDRWADEQPDKIFAIFADGSSWTYRDTRREARRAAAGFARLGVKPGELVLSWLPNGPDALRVWFGLNYIGAVYVPLNIAYRGTILEHAIRSAGSSLIVVHADLAPRLEAIDRAGLEHAVVLGGDAAVAGLSCIGGEALEGDEASLPPRAEGILPWHTQMVIFTSGTTGPSKGVLSSYLQCYTTALESFHYLGRDDRFIVNLPLFHVGGTGATFTAIVLGASIGLVDGELPDEELTLAGGSRPHAAHRDDAAAERGHEGVFPAFRLRRLYGFQHDGDFLAAAGWPESQPPRHLRPTAAGRRGSPRRRERLRGGPRRGRRTDRADGSAVGHEPWLSR